MSRTADLVVAGGVQIMSMTPMGTASAVGEQLSLGASPFASSESWTKRFGDALVSQFHGAEQIAKKWVSPDPRWRRLRSKATGAQGAIDSGKFREEIVVTAGVENDEGPRRNTSAVKMAGFPPLSEGRSLTAAVASQISDGASALLVASEKAVGDFGLEPLARIRQLSAVGSDPLLMLNGPILATQLALDRSGLVSGTSASWMSTRPSRLSSWHGSANSTRIWIKSTRTAAPLHWVTHSVQAAARAS